jgi:hypothetical protein
MEESSPGSGSGDSLAEPKDYIPPSLQDFLLLDVDHEKLLKMAAEMDVEYLKEASVFPSTFPVSGVIWGANHRLMVNLVCRRSSKNPVSAINVIFLVDTGSPQTYLSAAAYEALIGPGKESIIPETMRVQIQVEEVLLTCISPKGSHFANVNVLGMDFLAKQRLSIVTDFGQEEFELKRFLNFF